MKRIGIISDTHGYLDTIDLALDATMDQDIDMWLHAGDYGDDARYMQTRTDVPVYAVRGNNDRVQPLEPKEQLIPLEDTYIYMTHGHEVSYCKRAQELIHIGNAKMCIRDRYEYELHDIVVRCAICKQRPSTWYNHGFIPTSFASRRTF